MKVLFLVLDGVSPRHVDDGGDARPHLAGPGRRMVPRGRDRGDADLDLPQPRHLRHRCGTRPTTGSWPTRSPPRTGPVPAWERGPSSPTIFDAMRAAGRPSAAVFGDHHLVGVTGARAADSVWPDGAFGDGVALDVLGYAKDRETTARLLEAVDGGAELVVAQLNETGHRRPHLRPGQPGGPAALRAGGRPARDRSPSRCGRSGTKWVVIVVSDHSQEAVVEPVPIDLHAAAGGLGLGGLIVDDGAVAVVGGEMARDDRWLTGVAGVEGTRRVDDETVLAWAGAGRWFSSVSSPSGACTGARAPRRRWRWWPGATGPWTVSPGHRPASAGGHVVGGHHGRAARGHRPHRARRRTLTAAVGRAGPPGRPDGRCPPGQAGNVGRPGSRCGPFPSMHAHGSAYCRWASSRTAPPRSGSRSICCVSRGSCSRWSSRWSGPPTSSSWATRPWPGCPSSPSTPGLVAGQGRAVRPPTQPRDRLPGGRSRARAHPRGAAAVRQPQPLTAGRSRGASGLLDDLPDRLVIELTEQEAVSDYTHAPPRPRCRGWPGASRVAIDDTGAGYSSLRHVIELTPDFFKLDRELVRDLGTDKNRRALVSAMVAFASEVGTSVIAEGVETEAELDILCEAEVHLVQGYLLARPGPAWPTVGTGDPSPAGPTRQRGQGGAPASDEKLVRRTRPGRPMPAGPARWWSSISSARARSCPASTSSAGASCAASPNAASGRSSTGCADRSGITGRTWMTGRPSWSRTSRPAPTTSRRSPEWSPRSVSRSASGARRSGALNVESLVPLPTGMLEELERCAAMLGHRLQAIGDHSGGVGVGPDGPGLRRHLRDRRPTPHARAPGALREGCLADGLGRPRPVHRRGALRRRGRRPPGRGPLRPGTGRSRRAVLAGR